MNTILNKSRSTVRVPVERMLGSLQLSVDVCDLRLDEEELHRLGVHLEPVVVRHGLVEAVDVVAERVLSLEQLSSHLGKGLEYFI